MDNKKEYYQEGINNRDKIIKSHLSETENKVPILAGCKGDVCYCTGACRKVIGYRDMTAQEIRDKNREKL